MKLTKRVTTALGLAVTLLAASLPSWAGNLALGPDSKLWLEGKSTMHGYHSNASKLEATFEENASVWPADAQGGEAVERYIRDKGITKIQVVVPVAGMKSGKDGLDKNMQKALLASKNPDIRFSMTSYELTPAATGGEMTIAAKGMLTVAGVEREVQLPVKATREGDVVRLKGSTPLLMSQFGIKPPKMMMGTLKTDDQVTVHFDLAVGAKAAAGATKAE